MPQQAGCSAAAPLPCSPWCPAAMPTVYTVCLWLWSPAVGQAPAHVLHMTVLQPCGAVCQADGTRGCIHSCVQLLSGLLLAFIRLLQDEIQDTLDAF